MKKRKNIIISIFVILLFGNTLFSQNNSESMFGKSFRVGSSFTRIGDVNGDKSEGIHYLNESTLNVNVAMSVTKKLWLGLQIKPVFTKQYAYGTINKSVYNFNGIFTQFDAINKNGFRLYLESSVNLSNYCTCAKENPWDDPIKKNGIFFLGFGAGLELNLNPKKGKNIYLEVAFFNYLILNDIQFKYNYTQYILGLNYKFGKLN